MLNRNSIIQFCIGMSSTTCWKVEKSEGERRTPTRFCRTRVTINTALQDTNLVTPLHFRKYSSFTLFVQIILVALLFIADMQRIRFMKGIEALNKPLYQLRYPKKFFKNYLQKIITPYFVSNMFFCLWNR